PTGRSRSAAMSEMFTPRAYAHRRNPFCSSVHRARRSFSPSRAASTLGVMAPSRDQAPLQEVQRPLSGSVVLPDHEKILARGGVVPARDVGAVPHIESVDDREVERPGGLNDTTAHL